MPVKFVDAVAAQSATTGTGTYSLGSAVTGYRHWDTAATDSGTDLNSGDTVSFNVREGNQWENCIGVYTTGSPSTLTRVLVVTSSNGSNTAVNWSGVGPRVISSTILAAYIPRLESDGRLLLAEAQPVAKRTGSTFTYGSRNPDASAKGVPDAALALTFGSWANIVSAAIPVGTRRIMASGCFDAFNSSGTNNGALLQVVVRDATDATDVDAKLGGLHFAIAGNRNATGYAAFFELATATTSGQVIRLRAQKTSNVASYDLIEAVLSIDCTIA
jgi:hypothetical protein